LIGELKEHTLAVVQFDDKENGFVSDPSANPNKRNNDYTK